MQSCVKDMVLCYKQNKQSWPVSLSEKLIPDVMHCQLILWKTIEQCTHKIKVSIGLFKPQLL